MSQGGVPPNIDFEMRGGTHPDPEMDAIERGVAQEALNRYINIPAWTEMGLKRSYNFLHTMTFYMSRNPQIIKMMNRLQPYPEYIEMEVTQKCPLNCVMCEHTYWDEPDTELSYENFVKSMDQFPNLKWAGINALGSPLTNPRYLDMLEYLDKRDVVQEIYTDLAIASHDDLDRILKMNGFVFFKVSLDAATKETYEKIRVNASWDKVLDNVKYFDKMKRLRGKYFPELQFHFIIMKQNIHEAEQYLDFIDGLGVRATNVMYSRLLHNYAEVEKDTYCDIPDELVQRLVEKGKKLGIMVSVNADIGNNKPPANECMAWSMPYIFPDGSVITCCCMNEQNRREWQRQTGPGNILKTPFREIWNNQKYTNVREKLWDGKPLEAQECCKVCNIYDINKISNIRSVQ